MMSLGFRFEEEGQCSPFQKMGVVWGRSPTPSLHPAHWYHSWAFFKKNTKKVWGYVLTLIFVLVQKDVLEDAVYSLIVFTQLLSTHLPIKGDIYIAAHFHHTALKV